MNSMDQEVETILTFWFDERYEVLRWFRPSSDVDDQIRSTFGDLVTKARSTDFDHWTEKPQSTLAMLILLDQFPRNIFRGSPESYSSDAKAFDVSTKAIAKGFDREVPKMQQAFFYLPLMHNEAIVSQIAAKSLYEGLSGRCEPESKAKQFAATSVGFAQRHLEIIMAFGRFPSRNEVLGRRSTSQEVEFLKEFPTGF